MRGRKVNAVITGGSSGIGKAVGKCLAKRGANVFILARTPLTLTQALHEIREQRINKEQEFEAFSVDVRTLEEVKEAVKIINDYYGPPQVLVSSAGICRPNEFALTNPAVFQKEMETNYLGVVNAAQAVVPYLLDQQEGHIVNISSMAGLLPVWGYSSYAATKAAVIAFSRVMWTELKDQGIKVSVALPLDVDTPMLEKEEETKPAETKLITGSLSPRRPQNAKELLALLAHKLFVGEYNPSSAEEVAEALVQGMEKKKFLIFPDREMELFYCLYRPWDNLVHQAFRLITRLKPREESV